MSDTFDHYGQAMDNLFDNSIMGSGMGFRRVRKEPKVGSVNELFGVIKKETEKAFLITLDTNGKSFFIAKSQMRNITIVGNSKHIKFSVPRWLYKKYMYIGIMDE